MTTVSFSVLTGAGVSGELPADLPRGNTLRDDIVDECFAAAERLRGRPLSPELRRAIDSAGWKLEYVIGRLEGTIGSRARDCLKTLVIAVPNQAHMLLALHLVRGGRQITLNFDQGIEIAYWLITGVRELPKGCPREFVEQLPMWRALAQQAARRLVVVATEEEFSQWKPGAEPVLFKIHGSITEQQDGTVTLVDPWVIDDVEFAQLSPGRLRALDAMVELPAVITGYSGEDLDCYEPLLRRLDPSTFRWVLPNPDQRAHRELKNRLRAMTERAPGRGAARRRHQPEKGTAVDVLREELPEAPSWPEISDDLLDPFDIRFARWRAELADEELTEALAWMFMDATRYDTAIELYEIVSRRSGESLRLRLRMADAFYHRNRGTDKRSARAEFMRLALHRQARLGHRAYAFTRWGETFRPDLMVGGWRSLRPLLASAGGPAVGAAVAFLASDKVQEARALSALGHLGLRLLEGIMAAGPPRKALRAGLWIIDRVSLAALRRGIPHASGNRHAFMRQQRVELRALLTLLGAPPSPGLKAELDELAVMYERGTDPRGMANIKGARALVASNRSAAEALRWLRGAESAYRELDPPDGSGMALVERRRELIQAFRAAAAIPE